MTKLPTAADFPGTFENHRASTTPAFPAAKKVSGDVHAQTAARPGKVKYIALYNNCRVIAFNGNWAIIHATTFVCEGIARQLALSVYKCAAHPDYYVVDLRRAADTIVQA